VPREPSRRDHFLAPAKRGISVDDRMRQLAAEDREFIAARRAREAQYEASCAERRAVQAYQEEERDRTLALLAQQERDEQQRWINNDYQNYTDAKAQQAARDFKRSDQREDFLFECEGRLEDRTAAVDRKYREDYAATQPGLNFDRVQGEQILYAVHERSSNDAPMRKLFVS